MRKTRWQLVSLVVTTLFCAVPAALRAGTPTYNSGSGTFFHDPDDMSGAVSPANAVVNPIPGTMPGSFQLNNTFNNVASSTTGTGKMAYFATTSQCGFDLGTGTGVSQSDPSNQYTGSSVLTLNYNMKWDCVGTFGPNSTGYAAFIISGTIGAGGSVSFNATINFTNNSGATAWRTAAVFTQTISNPTGAAVPFNINLANSKYLNPGGLGGYGTNRIKNDVLKISGSLSLSAHNLGGPSEIDGINMELSGAPPTGTWMATGTSNWSNSISWLDAPDSGTPEFPIVPIEQGQRARFRPTSFGGSPTGLAVNVDVPVTLGTLDIAAADPYTFRPVAGGFFHLNNDQENEDHVLVFVNNSYGAGSHTVLVNTMLSRPVDMDIRDGCALTFGGQIGNAPGAIDTGLFKLGNGTLVLQSNGNSFDGNTNILGGTVVASAMSPGTAPQSLGTGNTLQLGGSALLPGGMGTLVFSGATGATDKTIIVGELGGAINVPSPASTLTVLGPVFGDGTFSKEGNGVLVFQQQTDLHGEVNVNSGTLRIQQPNLWTGLNVAPAASNAKFDVTNDFVVIDYTGTSPLSTIQSRISAAYSGATWTGPGITSGNAIIAAGTADKTGVGFAEATDLFSVFPATYRGFPVDPTSILIFYALYGDANGNGTVNSADFNVLALNFGGSGKRWSTADFTFDGVCNSSDFNALASNFGKVLPSGPGASVPEPGASGLLVGLIWLCRRWRPSACFAARSIR